MAFAARVATCVGLACATGCLAFGLLVGGTNSWIVLGNWGRSYARPDDAVSRSVAIVPGARATVQGTPMPQLKARLEAALALYDQRKVSAILVSGTDDDSDPEVRAMVGWLQEHDVPASDIKVDSSGFRTRETMARAAYVFHIQNAIVCTQSLSLPRALFLARKAGIDVDGVSLRTELETSPKWLGTEALKNTLAFVESYWTGDLVRATPPVIASR
jgi:vancomycin permeability regulator SanA